VLQPSFLPNFVATIDYYSIEIEDVITSGVGQQNMVDACYGFGVTTYCDRITRSATGEFESFVDLNVNSATLKTTGVDVDLTYNWELGFGLADTGASNLLFRMNGTYVDTWDFTPIDGLPIVNECSGAFGRNCGAPNPEWRHSFRTTWSSGPLDVSLLWRYLGEVDDDDPNVLYATENLDAANYFDLSGTWEFDETVTLGLGIDNVADTEPNEKIPSPQQGGNGEQSNTFPTVYDVIGRTYWATLKIKF
jgi:outer membrane receptor protein involved in Fe transport